MQCTYGISQALACYRHALCSKNLPCPYCKSYSLMARWWLACVYWVRWRLNSRPLNVHLFGCTLRHVATFYCLDAVCILLAYLIGDRKAFRRRFRHLYFRDCATGCGRRRGALRNMVHLLLRRGADPNASSVPLPPLLLAARSGDVDVVRELLLARADPQVMLPQTVCDHQLSMGHCGM